MKASDLHTETLIIGGGLAGLAAARALYAEGRDFLLVEARDRLGGRILTQNVGAGAFDLGPAWFWPGQPRMEALVAKLGLTRFEQYANGDLAYEDQNGVQRGQGYASMQGSYRLQGGIGALIAAMAETLPAERVRIGSKALALTKSKDGVVAKLSDAEITTDRVVLALPPRIAAQITYAPALPTEAVTSMHGISTWMAAQAKAVAVYDRPFWRETGLSGDAMSRVGPMVEIHDASPETDGPFALFGFIGVPPEGRREESELRQNVIDQLGRLFGPQAKTPLEILLKDWALDPHTSTQADLAPLHTHPQYGLPQSMASLWEGRFIFAGSEVAPQFGGYLEGALEAAEIAILSLKADLKTTPVALQ